MAAATTTAEHQTTLLQNPYALEKENSLISLRLKNGKLVTCKISYSYTRDRKHAVATLQKRDIRVNHHLIGSDNLKTGEFILASSCTREKKSQVEKLSILIINPNLPICPDSQIKEKIKAHYIFLAEKIFYASHSIFNNMSPVQDITFTVQGVGVAICGTRQFLSSSDLKA